MSRYDLSNEGYHLTRRPSEEPISMLGLLIVTPVEDALAFAVRLRSVIAGAIEISSSVDFERDEVTADALPSWFKDLSEGTANGVQGDPTGSEGKKRYLEFREDRPWNMADWICCFDPELRAWAWWDVTISEDGSVCVWVDTKGEAHIPCEELWWAIFVAGARRVDRMTLEASVVWRSQASVGLEY